MRAEKQLLLNDIKEKIDYSKGFIITQYNKMDSNLTANLRFSLYQTGSELEVIRKTIFAKAAQAAGFSISTETLGGHIGIIFALEDILKTSKTLFQFKKENGGFLEVIGGQFDGQLYSAKDMETFSTLPSKAEMQAQFLATLEAVPSQFLAAQEALLSSLCYCLDNKIKI